MTECVKSVKRVAHDNNPNGLIPALVSTLQDEAATRAEFTTCWSLSFSRHINLPFLFFFLLNPLLHSLTLFQSTFILSFYRIRCLSLLSLTSPLRRTPLMKMYLFTTIRCSARRAVNLILPTASVAARTTGACTNNCSSLLFVGPHSVPGDRTEY